MPCTKLKPWVLALLFFGSNLPTPDAFLTPLPLLKLRSSTTPSAATTTTALLAHSHLQAALQLIQGAASSPSATSASGTRRSCAAYERRHLVVSLSLRVCCFLAGLIDYPPAAPSSPFHSTPPTKTDPYTPPAIAQSVHRASLADEDAADLTGTGDSVWVVTQHKKKNSGPAITNYVEISLPTKKGMYVCVGLMGSYY